MPENPWPRLLAASFFAGLAIHISAGRPVTIRRRRRRPAGYGSDGLLSQMYRDPEHPLRRAVDDLEPADCSDVLEQHGVTVA